MKRWLVLCAAGAAVLTAKMATGADCESPIAAPAEQVQEALTAIPGLPQDQSSAPTGAIAETTRTTVDASAPRPLRHGVFRFNTYPAAWTAAQKTNRPILVYACSPACPNCVRMLGETYQTERVQQFVSGSFETVFIDRFEQPDMAAKLHLRWFPTTLIVSPSNKVIDVIEGYVDAATLERRLQTSLAAHAKSVEETQTR